MTSRPWSRSGQLIGSTVSWWLMEILMQPLAFLFFCCYSGDFVSSFHTHMFISKTAPYALMCVMPIHLKCMILVYFFWNHTNYCGANPDCSCHGNCLLGVMAPLKLKWNEKMRGSWGYTADTHTHSSLCANIFHISPCFVACAIGSLPWLETMWPLRFALRQCQKMNLTRVNGDKCSFRTKLGAKRSQSWDQLIAIYPLH